MLQKLKEIFLGNRDNRWICWGGRDGVPPHDEAFNSSDKCQICGLPRPSTPRTDKDKLLLVALTILNLGSGITTIKGATQIFPGFVGYSSGFTIQGLLFLLVSGSTLKHAPRLKWLTVASLSAISVYTSFFAYYGTLAGDKEIGDSIDRARAAHRYLVSKVYTPIETKVSQLESDIKTKEKEIEKESIPYCGPKCNKLKSEKKILVAKLNKLKPEKNKLLQTI